MGCKAREDREIDPTLPAGSKKNKFVTFGPIIVHEFEKEEEEEQTYDYLKGDDDSTGNKIDWN
jgi:hypothetical protein